MPEHRGVLRHDRAAQAHRRQQFKAVNNRDRNFTQGKVKAAHAASRTEHPWLSEEHRAVVTLFALSSL